MSTGGYYLPDEQPVMDCGIPTADLYEALEGIADMPDDTTAPDPVTAFLAEAEASHQKRHRLDGADYCTWDGEPWPCKPSRLLAAVRAGLAVADDLAATSGTGPGYNATRASGQRVREAITRELLGWDGTDG